MGERPLTAIVAEQLRLWSAYVQASQAAKEDMSGARASIPDNPSA